MTQAAPAPAPFSGPYTTPGPLLAPGIGPDGTYTRGGQILAFLAGLWTLVLFCPLLFPGAILYTKAEEVFPKDPDRARKLVLWSWLSITVAPLIGVLLVVGVMLIVRLATAD